MAINLDFQAAPVTRFARQDPYKEAGIKLAESGAAVNFFNTVGSVGARITDYERKKAEILRREKEKAEKELALKQRDKDNRDAHLQYSNLGTARAEQAKQQLNYSAELLEDTDYKGELFEFNAEGEKVYKRVPRHDALPYLKYKWSLEDAENAASKIQNPEDKEKFLYETRMAANEAFAKDLVAANKEAFKRDRAETDLLIKNSLDAGDFAGARNIISTQETANAPSFTKQELTEYRKAVNSAEEIKPVNDLLGQTELTEEEDAELARYEEYFSPEKYKGARDDKEVLAIQATIRRRRNRHKAENQVKKKTASIEKVMALEDAIKSDDPAVQKPTREQLQHWRDVGFPDGTKLPDSQYNSLIRLSKKQAEKVAEQNMIVVEVNDALLNNRTVPQSKEVHDALESDFKKWSHSEKEKSLLAGQSIPTDRIIERGLLYVNKYNYMPDELKDILKTSDGGSSDEMLKGAAILIKARASRPGIEDSIPESARENISRIADSLQAGLTNYQALKHAAAMQQLTTEQKKNLRSEAAEDLKISRAEKTNDLFTWLEDHADKDEYYDTPTFFDARPELSSDFKARFSAAYSRIYVAEFGNENIARVKAYNATKKTFALSQINKPTKSQGTKKRGLDKFIDKTPVDDFEYMPYSPVDKNDAMGSAQLFNYLQMEYKDMLEPEQVAVLVSDETVINRAMLGQPLVYKVYAADKQGHVNQIGNYIHDAKRNEYYWSVASELESKKKEIMSKVVQDVALTGPQGVAPPIMPQTDRLTPEEAQKQIDKLLPEYKQLAEDLYSGNTSNARGN